MPFPSQFREKDAYVSGGIHIVRREVLLKSQSHESAIISCFPVGFFAAFPLIRSQLTRRIIPNVSPTSLHFAFGFVCGLGSPAGIHSSVFVGKHLNHSASILHHFCFDSLLNILPWKLIIHYNKG